MAIQQTFYKLANTPVAGSATDDLIFVDLPAALGTNAIDGNAGTDILRIIATKPGAYAIQSVITNIETIEISESLDANSSSTTRGDTSGINVDASVQSTSLAIYGNDGTNEIRGGSAADTIYGYGGNDVIYGNGDADVLYGGDGDDLFVLTGSADLSYGLSDDLLNGGAGTDKLVVGLTADKTFTISDSTNLGVEEVVLGTVTAGKITADTAGSHLTASALTTGIALTGNGGANKITGGSGNDTLTGGAGADTLSGGAGDDTFVYNLAADLVTAESISGGAGTDTILLQGANSYKFVGVNLDTIEKITAGGKLAVGMDASTQTANLTLNGNTASNAIIGGSGNDTITGGGGSDKLVGGAGNDLFVFGKALNNKGVVVDGGAGIQDVIVFNETLASQSTDLNTLTLSTTAVAVEYMVVDDTDITSTGLNLDGTKGGTLALGLNAAAMKTAITLVGNGGNNTLTGGAGMDTLIGGGGSDAFVFTAGTTIPTTTSLEIIKDWGSTTGNSDVIDYTTALLLGGGLTTSTATAAGIATSGVAEFTNVSNATALASQILAVALSLDDKTSTNSTKAGEVAYWLNGADSYVFISDGKAGTATAPVTSGDVLIKLENFDYTGKTASLVSGNMVISADTSAGGAGKTTVLTSATDSFTGSSSDDTVDGVTNADSISSDTITDSTSTDNDVLNIAVTGNINPASVVKMETVNVTAKYGSATVDASKYTGVNIMNLISGVPSGSVTVNKISSTSTAALVAGSKIASLTLTTATSGTGTTGVTVDAGSATALSLTGTGSNADVVSFKFNGTPATLTLSALTDTTDKLTLNNDVAASVITLSGNLPSGSTTLTGSKDLTLIGSTTNFNGKTVTDSTTGGTTTVQITATTAGHNLSTVGVDAFNITAITADNDDLKFADKAKLTLTGFTSSSNTLKLDSTANNTGTLYITVNGSGASLAAHTAGTDDFATLSISATQTTTVKAVMTAATTGLVLTGSNDITLTNTTKAKSVNATALTGKLTATLAADLIPSLTGGSSADDVTLSGAQTAGITASLGGGNDTLTLADAVEDMKYVLDGGTGTGDTLKLTTANNTFTIGNTSKTSIITGFETIDLNGYNLTLTQLQLFTNSNSNGVPSFLLKASAVGNLLTVTDDTTSSPSFDLSGITFGSIVPTKIKVDGNGSNANTIKGSTIPDSITGGTGADTIDGGSGNDTITALAGNDILTGGAGNDSINAAAGTDSIDGGSGDDIFVFNSSDVGTNETISGGGGTDTISVVTDTDFTNLSTATILTAGAIEQILITSAKTATFTGAQLTGQAIAVNASASGGTENLNINVAAGGTVNLSTMTFADVDMAGASDAFTSGTDVINITATTGATSENITGTSLADVITGDAGDDVITGGAGADSIKGGAGADVIDVGSDSDADKVVLSDKATADSISNFDLATSSTQKDILQVSIGGIALLKAGSGSVGTGSVAASDAAAFQTISSAGAVTTTANNNVFVFDNAAFNSASAIQTAIRTGGGTVITFANANATGDFLAIYDAGADAHVAVISVAAAADTSTATVTDIATLVGVSDLTNLNIADLAFIA